METVGIRLTHSYGLTETYGPASICEQRPDWQALPLADRAERNARQGVRYALQDGMTVVDPVTLPARLRAAGFDRVDVRAGSRLVFHGYPAA